MIEFTDRYKAAGVPYPDPETMCTGDCEGLGFVPIKVGGTLIVNENPEYVRRWHEAEAEKHSDDGWHFVKCLQCNGTGKKEKP